MAEQNSSRRTRPEDKARLAHQGIRIQAGDGGYYVIVATGRDRANAEKVAEVVYLRAAGETP